MSVRPIDFHGLIDLDKQIVEHLEKYLHQKEAQLAHQLLTVIQPMPVEAFAPLLPFNGGHLKLSEAVEVFTKKMRLLIKEGLKDNHIQSGEQALKKINQALWEFTEVLEGCVVELFQQIKLVSVDRWHVSIAHVTLSIKNSLMHYMDDLIWAIRRLEEPLKAFSLKFYKDKGKIPYWFSFLRSAIDPNLLKNLKQCEKYLNQQYQDFDVRYNEFLKINQKVEEILDKMKNYPILALLDINEQNLYIDVFRLLKMLELNRKPRGTLAGETVRSLKNLASVDNILRVLRIYYRELKDAFFNSSYELKTMSKERGEFSESLEKLKVKVNEYENELKHLISTMVHYRLFILKSDANPYIRSRLGFSEWIVGPEPLKAKKLLNLIYSAEELKLAYQRFMNSLNTNFQNYYQIIDSVQLEIEKLLHEMAQPLIARSMMQRKGEKLLEELKKYDEIGNPYLESIEYMDKTLSKAMREDWKYHVLHGFPAFHEIYRMHLGLCDFIEDPSHAFRMERFRLLFDQIEEWVNQGDVYSHVHEVELDINDMKTYLQDYLAAVQRAARENFLESSFDDAIYKFKQQLLEYRYIFGQFFFILLEKEGSGQLRNQFLFVDQYFETVENLIAEINLPEDIQQ